MAIAEADLKVGDRVVYPNQGVCRVVGVTDMEIGGQRETFIKLSREDDQATVMVPKGRVEKVGLRRVADTSEINTIFNYLASPVEGPELDWKVRHRTHGERMSEGGLMGLAQVVKGLTTLSDLRPLPPKERELYDNARHLLVSEIAAAMSFSEVMAEDAVDIALFPPGVERKKPELALPLGEEGEELGLGEDLELVDEAALEPEAAVEAEGGEEAEGEEAEAEEGEEVEVEEEGEEAPKKKARAAKKPAAPKAPKAKKVAAKAAKPKAEKPAAKKAAKAEKPAAKKPKAEKPAPAKKAAAKKTKSKK